MLRINKKKSMNFYPLIISQGGKLSTSATLLSYSKNMTVDKKTGNSCKKLSEFTGCDSFEICLLTVTSPFKL